VIVPGQMIEVKWGSRNKEYYERLGYKYTHIGDVFTVSAEDLKDNVNTEIQVTCEHCRNSFYISKFRFTHKIKSSKSIYCQRCRYIKQVQQKAEQTKHYDVVQIHDMVFTGKLEKYPQGFFTSITEDEAVVLTKKMLRYNLDIGILKSIEEAPKKISQTMFKNYKIVKLSDMFGLHNLAYKALDGKYQMWEFHRHPKQYWEKYENRRAAFDWFIQKLKDQHIISDIQELPKVKDLHGTLRKHNLGGLLHYYKQKISTLIFDLCPNQFRIWDVNVEKGFYQKEENKMLVMKQFIELLFEDKIITAIEEIPKVAKRELFEQYGLGSFLAHCFRLSPYIAFNYVYPDRWKRWEFCHVPNGFWDDPKNLRDCLVWFVDKLIEDRVIKSVDGLNDINLNKLLAKYRLASLINKYDIPFMLSMIYGNAFNYHNYKNKISTKDGVKLDSVTEKSIHNILVSNMTNVVKPTMHDRHKFRNELFNETYVPDWIVNGDIIIEYFGLYDNNANSDYIRRYTEKTSRKIAYYKSLRDYKFIALYPSDLRSDYKGLKKKLSNLNLTIAV